MLRLRLRGPSGAQVTGSFDPTQAHGDFLKDTAARFGETALEMLVGFPPVACGADEATPLGALVTSGASVTFRRLEAAAPPTPAPAQGATAQPPPARGGQGAADGQPPCKFKKGEAVEYQDGGGAWVGATVTVVSFDHELSVFYTIRLVADGREKGTIEARLRKGAAAAAAPGPWACTACTFENDPSSRACSVCATPRAGGAGADAKSGAGGGGDAVANGSGGGSGGTGSTVTVAVLEKMRDDNSCLFHAVAWALGLSQGPTAMRQAIGAAVLSDPARWNEGTLGKTPRDYVAFINNPVKWGGQVGRRGQKGKACELKAWDTRAERSTVESFEGCSFFSSATCAEPAAV